MEERLPRTVGKGWVPRAAAALRDLRSQGAGARRRLRAHPAAPLAGGQLQPFPAQKSRSSASAGRVDRHHPRGAGPEGWYTAAGRRHVRGVGRRRRAYRLDPEWTSTRRLDGRLRDLQVAGQYPDLFAQGAPDVGTADVGVSARRPGLDRQRRSNTESSCASARHIPFLMWRARRTSSCHPGAHAARQQLRRLGYRYDFLVLPRRPLRAGRRRPVRPAADFLGDDARSTNPPHVTLLVNQTMNFAAARPVADHAYWVSGVTPATRAGYRRPSARRRALARLRYRRPHAVRRAEQTAPGGPLRWVAGPYNRQTKSWPKKKTRLFPTAHPPWPGPARHHRIRTSRTGDDQRGPRARVTCDAQLVGDVRRAADGAPRRTARPAPSKSKSTSSPTTTWAGSTSRSTASPRNRTPPTATRPARSRWRRGRNHSVGEIAVGPAPARPTTAARLPAHATETPQIRPRNEPHRHRGRNEPHDRLHDHQHAPRLSEACRRDSPARVARAGVRLVHRAGSPARAAPLVRFLQSTRADLERAHSRDA